MAQGPKTKLIIQAYNCDPGFPICSPDMFEESRNSLFVLDNNVVYDSARELKSDMSGGKVQI